MASPAETTKTTKNASKFGTKRRAVQPPICFLELISWVTTGMAEPWPACQPKEPWPDCHKVYHIVSYRLCQLSVFIVS